MVTTSPTLTPSTESPTAATSPAASTASAIGGWAPASPLVALRSRTGAALIAATVLASGVASYDANVIKVAVPAIGRSLGAGSRPCNGR